MKSYSSRDVIKILEENGWYFVRCVGDLISLSINQTR
jgi:predicted RNA binding protein YcfA (HicA-like mRNA interferase family)